jgi:hypothetical protein
MRKQFSFHVYDSTGSAVPLEIWTVNGQSAFRTGDGREVIRVESGQYRIVQTGEMLNVKRPRPGA